MARAAARQLFWTSAGLIVHAYIAFPLVAALRGLMFARPVAQGHALPPVSLIIAAYNEAGLIERKLENALELDYPRDRLEIIVASDGSSDGTNELVRCDAATGVRLLELPRQGKNGALNAAAAAAGGEILVFTDADARLAPDALRRLVAPLADSGVGAVAGERQPGNRRDSRRRQIGWMLRRGLRELLSRAGSVTAAEGQIHAVRRELFRPLPMDVNDDFFISVGAVAAHRRLVYEPRAASQPFSGSTALRAPFRRKVRQTERWLRALWHVRGLLNPFQHGFYAFQLMSHKLLRRLAFAPLLVLAVTGPMLWRCGKVYRVTTLAQLSLHGGAALGLLLRHRRARGRNLLRGPLLFDMAHAASLVAMINVARHRGRSQAVWIPQRPSAPSEATQHGESHPYAGAVHVSM
jgi:cellulose synthase/poly-beta-1,6-N-acetylglucosamine synthase-like glycosyltransferase